MHSLYIQTYSEVEQNPENPDRPAWTHPLLAQITAVYHNTDGNIQVFALGPDGQSAESLNLPSIKLTLCSNECEVLSKLWLLCKNEPSAIYYTFNGRVFTIPFLYIRSAKYGLLPSHPFMLKDRYKLSNNHCDVADQIAFNGLITRPSLHQVANYLGLQMPAIQEEHLQKLLVQHLGKSNPVFLKSILSSGIAYSNLIQQIAHFWLTRLKPVTV